MTRQNPETDRPGAKRPFVQLLGRRRQTAICGRSKVDNAQRSPFLCREKPRLASRRTETALNYRVEDQYAGTVCGHLAPFVALTR